MYRILLYTMITLLACTKSIEPIQYKKLTTDTQDIIYRIIKNDQYISIIGGYVWSHGYEKKYDLSLNLTSTDTFSDKGLFDICITASGDMMTVGTDGYLFEKKKDLSHWKFHRLSHWDILEKVFETTNGYIAYGGKAYETGYIYHLNRDFSTDTVIYFGHEISHIFTSTSGRMISAGWGQIDLSNDGGLTWQTLDIKGDFFVSGLFTDSRSGIVIGANGTILRTEDEGASWQKTNSNITGNGFNSFRSITKIDDLLFILGTKGKLWKSKDGGLNWTLIQINDDIDIYDLKKIENQDFLICGSNGTFAKITL